MRNHSVRIELPLVEPKYGNQEMPHQCKVKLGSRFAQRNPQTAGQPVMIFEASSNAVWSSAPTGPGGTVPKTSKYHCKFDGKFIDIKPDEFESFEGFDFDQTLLNKN